MNLARSFVVALSLALAVSTASAQDHWVASWGAASVKGAGQDIPAGGITYRDIVHLSMGGKKVRLTLSNHFNSEPLNIGGMSVGLSSGQGGVTESSLKDVRFGGKPSTVIAPGATVVSDPVSLDVAPLGDLAVSIFLPEQKVVLFTDHPISHATNYRAAGNQLRAGSMTDAKPLKPWSMLTAVDVAGPRGAGTIVAFGDSITDGTGTAENANHRWPNLLAARLQQDPKHTKFAVVDEGIGGNRILHEGGDPGSRAGQHPSGLDRWDYDALERSGVKYIIILEGVNDIGHSSLIRSGGAKARQEKSPEQPVTADDLIQALTKMIDAAHAKGVKVIGATLTPFGGANYDRPDGDETHKVLNEFIRHGGKFDGVIDFEKATQDPANPLQYKPGFNDRDHLHPNDAGAKAMADSIDLNLFK